MGKIKDFLAETGWWILGVVLLVVIFFISSLLFHGVGKVSIIILPWLNKASIISFLIFVIILIPLSLFRKTKAISGHGMMYASFVF